MSEITKKNPDRRFKINTIKITKEDIERNVKLIKEGKPLDLPLHLLDGPFKKKFDVGGPRRNAYLSLRSYLHGDIKTLSVEFKVEWCMWFLYYYNRWIENE